ncbi:hypothetical protein VTO7225_00941 [Vibrio toranzoniae]|jgi:hypothetical protein|nr:hypothetical protein VTO7225_00941 [Vibrio toranzoniae]
MSFEKLNIRNVVNNYWYGKQPHLTYRKTRYPISSGILITAPGRNDSGRYSIRTDPTICLHREEALGLFNNYIQEMESGSK